MSTLEAAYEQIEARFDAAFGEKCDLATDARGLAPVFIGMPFTAWEANVVSAAFVARMLRHGGAEPQHAAGLMKGIVQEAFMAGVLAERIDRERR